MPAASPALPVQNKQSSAVLSTFSIHPAKAYNSVKMATSEIAPAIASPGQEKQDYQVKSVDMTPEMQEEAIEVARDAMAKYTIEKDIAQHIKKEFDSRKGATWHCIVGRNFGSFVTHETKHFIYFYLGHCAILLFKTQ